MKCFSPQAHAVPNVLWNEPPFVEAGINSEWASFIVYRLLGLESSEYQGEPTPNYAEQQILQAIAKIAGIFNPYVYVYDFRYSQHGFNPFGDSASWVNGVGWIDFSSSAPVKIQIVRTFSIALPTVRSLRVRGAYSANRGSANRWLQISHSGGLYQVNIPSVNGLNNNGDIDFVAQNLNLSNVTGIRFDIGQNAGSGADLTLKSLSLADSLTYPI